MFNFDLGDDLPEGQQVNCLKMKPVFHQFGEYLKKKGLKKETVQKKVQMVVLFIFEFLYVYSSVDNVFFIDGDTIRTFLGNWYIRKVMNPRMKEIRGFLNAIADFFTFLKKKDLIFKEDLQELKETGKDKEWFEIRLATYFQFQWSDFQEWIEEYN